ncbi:SAM-dependent methyltransferases [Bacillus sp. OxB-1]|uniref:class I SAM-dependent methyltransferase n=1 Tax=Bacillus sp. (strain OxB-1) TaxID=98228 RepID=UPI0005820628|nr:class I SAM-dependent methyltransferase [Bacillus sp. OxB-1]BAQ09712.1 SAM-dependent methyltransferases [Bacillus sp. OxB-1]
MKIDVTGKVDFAEMWREGIKDWDGNLPERMVNDDLEESFWEQMMERKSGVDAYSLSISEELLTLVGQKDKVLEIGPGWGNYTFSLAQHARHITCVDSSASVLAYLKEESGGKGLTNLDYVHSKWEDFQAEKAYDVVFGMNCFYRMFDIAESMRTIDRAAKRLAIVGMTSGPLAPHYTDLQQSGYALKMPRRDYIHLINVLYELGIYANCRIIPLTRTNTYETYDQLLTANRSRFPDDSIDPRVLGEALDRYVVYENGKYIYSYPFHSALIYWTPGRGN